MAKRILIACEESDEVRSRFAALGFDAWSCDLQPNRNPFAKHYQENVLDIINNGWDALIAFPPCTHLASSGAAHFFKKKNNGTQKQAIEFFMQLVNAPVKYIAIENPVGIMSTEYRKPDQIIHPYYFGDNVPKKTCLWLKNLPKLVYCMNDNLFEKKTAVVPEYVFYHSKKNKSGYSRYSVLGKISSSNNPENAKIRSKTFPGIAQAIADQWSLVI
jgi:site-specific DNA-cytosine methylase